jgi:hypothetical protein
MPTTALETVRRWLAIVLFIGLIGTEAELLLLKHFDGFWQLVPVTAIGAATAILGWYVLGTSRASIRAVQAVMIVFVATGMVGTVQHVRGNVEHERESDPSIAGMELYRRSMMGSTPALAPGAMIQLGLIGLLLTYRHPRLGRDEST